jgi:hypothetical protein
MNHKLAFNFTFFLVYTLIISAFLYASFSFSGKNESTCPVSNATHLHDGAVVLFLFYSIRPHALQCMGWVKHLTLYFAYIDAKRRLKDVDFG